MRLQKKQYHGLNKVHRFDKEDDEITNKKAASKKYNKSDLIYNNKCSFYEYYDIEKFNGLLVSFNKKLNKYNSLEPRKRHTKETKSIVYRKASKRYNELLETHFDGYNNFSVAKTKKIGSKYEPKELFLEDYCCDSSYDEGDIPTMPRLEGDKEEVK